MQELSLNILDIAENSVKAGAALITVAVEYRTARDRLTVTIVPRSARSSCWAPMFWLTKVVAAMAMLCMGSMMNWSSLL